MPVNMGSKCHTSFCNIPQFRQRKDLKSTAVRKHRARPASKIPNSPEFFYRFITGTEMKVISIAQLNLTVQILEIVGGDSAFDRSGSCLLYTSDAADE